MENEYEEGNGLSGLLTITCSVKGRLCVCVCKCVFIGSKLHQFISYHVIIISHHIIDLKRQNRLKVGTNKPKLKVKMQSVSDDNVLKRLRQKPRFELAAKGVFSLLLDTFMYGTG